MHVVLISSCEKRAIKRTRAVLDSYALRHGDYTWMTSITLEGLQELRGLLRRSATRQTSVACFVNDGRKRMRLLWIVGNQQHFDRFGISPIGTRLRKGSARFPEWARVCAILAAAAGETHDLGKFGKTFQDKLRKPQPSADPVRHEWLSFLLVKQWMEGTTPMNAAWTTDWQALSKRRFNEIAPFDAPLKSARDVLLFLVATHHRLLASEKDSNYTSTGNHVRTDNTPNYEPIPVASPSSANWERIEKRLEKVRKLPTNSDPLYWRGIATVARMALILADHAISAELTTAQDAPAYANTHRKTGQLNQSLDWHLEQVGREAGCMISRILELAPPWLATDTLEELDRPAQNRFAWQNLVADALRRSAEINSVPHLVLNMAGTGSGKTRMNVRALAVLGPDRKLRIATALNLRTLTLQTADAYTQQLRMGADELACVIGDRVTRKLHQWQQTLNENKTDQELLIDDDENVIQAEIDTAIDTEERFFTYTSAPEWLQRFLERKPNLAAVIGAPVLVSTIDFLIAAGEPHRQAHHALAMLRIMTSDLILDEIDGYDPKPLVAVLRLVMMAAFWGRNVVASSATLSRPVAEALWRAYAKGGEMRAKVMGGEGRFVTAIIDDLVEPLTTCFTTLREFMSAYERHVGKMLPNLIGKRFRVPYLAPVNPPGDSVASPDLQPWYSTIKQAVKKLHKTHAWIDPITGKRISFGLVRVANISGAIPVARELAEIKGARVVCYHSQLLTLQRHHIETTLDCLLNRKNGDGHILRNPEVRAAIERCDGTTVAFIVVATPVEEIGRDHDFDWAVIEPSSVQSIVQTAGRVNRHRLMIVDQPNVALLQFNRKAIREGANARVFQHPGFEVGENRYPTHDLKELLGLDRIEQIDARLRFDEHHPFAKLDDLSIASAMKDHLNTALSEELTEQRRAIRWIVDATYKKAPLREFAHETIWLVDGDRFYVLEYHSDGSAVRINKDLKPINIKRHDNDWLVLDIPELQARGQEMGISPKDGLRVPMTAYSSNDNQQPKFDRSFGWYY